MTKSCVALGIVIAMAQIAQAQPISLNQENPHYFEYKNKPAVLITSAEHYGAVLNLDFDYKTYLDELHAKKLNLTRVFSGAYCEPPGAFNIGSNTLAPAPNRLIAPWARSDQAGYRNGGNKFDLNKWNENYFVRLKDFMKEAARRDIIVEFTLFCPFYEDTMWVFSPLHPANNVNATPDIPRTDVYTLDKSGAYLDIQKKLTKKLVTELNGFDNLMIEICNEPYWGGVTMDWQHAITNVIVETESTLPKKHLITQNIQNAGSLITDPHPKVSVFNFHYAYPPYTVAWNYHLNKPIGDNETGFRGTSDSTYRFEGWRFIMAGGALFNHLDYSFGVGHEAGTYQYHAKQPGGGNAAFREQIKYLREFVEKFEFVKMSPDSTVIAHAPKALRYNALVEEGREYAIYMIDDTTTSVALNIPTGRYEVQWMHPLTGQDEKVMVRKSKNNMLSLDVPPHKEDIALSVVKK